MKTISIFLALLNSLLAGLILAFSLSPTEIHQTPVWWSLMKVTAASFVILAGILTWLGSARSLHFGMLGLCSLFMVALGAATAVWTFHIVLVSGDIAFHTVVYGGSFAAQGVASLFGFARDTRNMDSI